MASKVTKLTTHSPLALLRQIRDVMSQAASAQARLDDVVRIIADGFTSEVCSVYLLRAGDVLELYASRGLKATSVHLTRLSVGRGLVGTIAANAEALNLADASAHPMFEYRPETGEEIYSSFVGVTILQGGRVIGVLVVQGKQAHSYTQDQVEVLQTVAMVLSELAMSGQLVDAQEIKAVTGVLMAEQMAGTRLSAGIAKAPAVLHQPQLTITNYVATDTEHEKERFSLALQSLQDSFDRYIQTSGLSDGDEQREIIETYLLFTQDRGWLTRIDEAISSGLTAEAAVRKVQEELQAKMSQITNLYIKERIQDLEDLSTRLLHVLLGKPMTQSLSELPEAFILVARTLGPADLLDYDHKRIKGLILEEGSTSSHTAVIARAMDIPALARVEGATSVIQQGDMVIIDGDASNVYVRPSYTIEQAMDKHIEAAKRREAEYAVLRDVAAVTTDGVRISLNINAGLFVDTSSVLQEGVEGIGLYRTELPYMTSSSLPEVEVQQALYAQMYQEVPGKRIIFRSFDIGGDKKVPYLNAGDEENPAMGWRATRIGLDRPGILRKQFRALIGAASGQALHVMFPFIAQVSEFDAAKKLFLLEWELAQKAGNVMPVDLKIGVMVEIPSLMWQLPQLMSRVDFVSIGSNDLMQFLFACDRGAAHMADAYDTLSPVMLRVVRDIMIAANEHKVEVSFCGEMARRPLDAMALIGVGVRSVSVSASAIGPIKAMTRSLSAAQITEFMSFLIDSDEPSLRHRLAGFAQDHGIVV
ncbi:MAG: phosphoenolpyruvate--protein phosphotransferase [Alphaproteobacteria bacterium]|nr:phosphoenolpyruvate--protein phosphotransferase [Alphaproteobacteria bacterium]